MTAQNFQLRIFVFSKHAVKNVYIIWMWIDQVIISRNDNNFLETLGIYQNFLTLSDVS